MPCEFVPPMVNNTYIAMELELNEPNTPTMYKTKLESEKNRLYISQGFGLESERHYGKAEHEDYTDATSDFCDKKYNPKMSQHRVFGHRTLPRVFSTLGDFGVIQETSTASGVDDVCMSTQLNSVPRLEQKNNFRRKSTANAGRKTRFEDTCPPAESSPENYPRRKSEGSIFSARGVLGLMEYDNESERISMEQRSESTDTNISVLERGNDTGDYVLVSNTSRRSSFTAMNVIPENLSDSRRYYSLPRKLSIPVENHRDTEFINGKKQRNSAPTSSKTILRNFALDNDTDAQWERLVARARSFQTISAKRQETISSEGAEKTDEGKKRKDVDKSSGNESGSEDIEEKENSSHDSVDSTKPQIKSPKQQNVPSELIKHDTKGSGEIQTKKNSSISVTEDDVSKSGQLDMTVNSTANTEPQIDRNARRYSLATVRHPPELREKISGYSTHGALEYARMLLGKIQSEGKSKGKKERLDEMSKALKMVLEELNRIEVPDRDLVSLFISLRAKIVNLKAELKDEEKDGLTNHDRKGEQDVTVLSKTLPRVRSTSESVITPKHFRRFSWC